MATRLEIQTEVLSRIDRSDATTIAEVDDWIARVVRTVEEAYPLPYTQKSQTTPLTPDEELYELPTLLITHHPYELYLETTDAIPTFNYMVKVGNQTFDLYYPDQLSTKSGTPSLWILRGGTTGGDFQLYPVPNQAKTVRLMGGYYRTDTSSWTDSSTNYLTDNEVDLLVEGVCAKVFVHVGEPQNAALAKSLYDQYLNGDGHRGIKGLIQKVKMSKYQGRKMRIKKWDDIPVGTARAQRFNP